MRRHVEFGTAPLARTRVRRTRSGTAMAVDALLLVMVTASCAGPPRERPSVVLILVDTLRADYLGCYGFEGPISPNVDRLASEAWVFTRCSAPAPWTKPSVASLFTSLYPEVHGVTDNNDRYWSRSGPGGRASVVPETAHTLAEALRSAGYRTAAFVANPWINRHHGFDQGFEVFGKQPRTRVLLGRAREWLATLKEDESYFLYLHLMDVHAPYRAPRADYVRLRDSPSLGTGQRLTQRDYDAIPWHLEGESRLKGAERRQLRAWRAKYAAGVRAFDRRLAPFLRELRRTGHLDRSVVVLTSDHGEELLERGGWNHGETLHEEQLHVPLVVRPPGGLSGTRRSEDVVNLLDVMPTLLAWAGTEPSSALQGRVIHALLDRTSREPGVSHSSTTLHRPNLHALRTATHKLIVDLSVDEDETELFDLLSDPGERNDIAHLYPGLAAELKQLLQAHLDELASRGVLEGETAALPEDVRERLRSLGYAR